MTINLEKLHKQQVAALNNAYAQTLQAATGMTHNPTPAVAPQVQANTASLEKQMADMQASMNQMMQLIQQQQQQMMYMQQAHMQPQPVVQQPIVQHAQVSMPQPEPVTPVNIAEPMPVATDDLEFKVSTKLIKSCHSCPFQTTCGMKSSSQISDACGETINNKHIMLAGGMMQVRYNFEENLVQLLSNGKVVAVVEAIKSNQNQRFVSHMVKHTDVLNVRVVSDQKQPNSIYTNCQIQIIASSPIEEEMMVQPIPSCPSPEPAIIPANEEVDEEVYLTEEELANYDLLASLI